MARSRGYILVETIVAMALLSVTMLTIHAGMRQAFIAIGESEDYTTARFLLQDLMANIELQSEVVEGHESGRFPGENARFSYEWSVCKIDITPPKMPTDMAPEMQEAFRRQFVKHMGVITVRVKWTRMGGEYVKEGQTLFSPEAMWTPPELDELWNPLP